MSTTRRILALAAVLMGLGFGPAGPARAQDANAPAAPAGAQVLTQGPIHEAFATPLIFDPRPGPVVPKTPPEAINEVPPEEKPAGDDVAWIPGYWSWDDSRNDFVWVSGVWRKLPPGRQWIPGYWRPANGGSQWVPGYWAAADAGQVQYLPAPPTSLEQGPTSPQPSAESVWVPGLWSWQQNQYAWRPGFWTTAQQGWTWMPAHYAWTPQGYVMNQGYWDYPLATRGMPFAPVYFGQRGLLNPGAAFTPGVSLMTSALLSSLFVRPAYGSYYFGDYYGANYAQSGFLPWYALNGGRQGYDPLFASVAARQMSSNPNWMNELRQVYDYRRDHPEARPPRTFAESRTMAARPVAGNIPAAARNLMLARPLGQGVTGGTAAADGLRLERIDAQRREALARQATQLHQFRAERLRREAEAANVGGPAAGRPLPPAATTARSPIAAPATPAAGPAGSLPPSPRQPAIDRTVRPATPTPPPARVQPRTPATAPGRPGVQGRSQAEPAPTPNPQPAAPGRPGAPGRPSAAPAPARNPQPAGAPGRQGRPGRGPG